MAELDHWVSPVWLDEDTLVATSDDQGRGSVWIGGFTDPAPRRLAGGPGQDLAFSAASVAGGAIIASASGIAVAPYPVRIDPTTGEVHELPNPADAVAPVGTLTEVTATAEDGTALRAWLRLPEGEGPHPLVVFAHGGPWGSWNAWTYRWNPNPFVDAGYAVLLPDPAISTGYGQAMIDRGQHELGGAPYTDIMALTDATEARADIDAERTAFAGGSYGGYMANWVAGHTGDRFRCIVTHASLWDTETMGHTTDNSGWDRPMRTQNPQYNPKEHVRYFIVVPMLVIHGDKDYRVPIAQGHALWYDLHEFSATPRRRRGPHPPPLPLLPRRRALDPRPRERAGLVRDVPRLPRRARARRGVAASGDAGLSRTDGCLAARDLRRTRRRRHAAERRRHHPRRSAAARRRAVRGDRRRPRTARRHRDRDRPAHPRRT